MNLLNILTVIFVIAKLTDYIDWSWWIVFAPTLIQVVTMIGTVIGLVIYAARKK